MASVAPLACHAIPVVGICKSNYPCKLSPCTCCFLALTSPWIFWTVSAVSFVRRWNVA